MGHRVCLRADCRSRKVERGLAAGAILSIGLALVGCSSAAQRCYDRGDFDCAASLARASLANQGRCCECRALLAKVALRRFDEMRPAGSLGALADLLDGARVEGGQALACRPADRGVRALQAEIAARSTAFGKDAMPELWAAVESVSNPDERVRAALFHRRFYGDRCQHDLHGLLLQYLAGLRAAKSSADIERRMDLLRGSEIFDEVQGLFRTVLYRELVAENDEASWLRRIDVFRGTELEPLVQPQIERALRARVESATTPEEVEALCGRVAFGDRVRCWSRFRELTLRRAVESPSEATIRAAQEACRGTPCAHESQLIGFRYVARLSHDRLVATMGTAGAKLGRSKEAWLAFRDAFDRFARRIGGRTSSFEVVDPELSSTVNAHIIEATKESQSILAGVNGRWTNTKIEIASWWRPNIFFRDGWLREIDSQLRDLVVAIQLDGSNRGAAAMVDELIAERRRLDDKTDMQVKILRTGVELAAGEVLGLLEVPNAARIGLNVAYAVVQNLK